MPGSINLNVKIETHDRLLKRKGDKSWSELLDELLDIVENIEGKPVINPSNNEVIK